MQPAEGPAPPPRRRLRRVLQALVSLAIGWALLVGVLPRLADLGQVWEIVRSMTFLNTLVLVALAVWNLFGYAFVMMAAPARPAAAPLFPHRAGGRSRDQHGAGGERGRHRGHLYGAVLLRAQRRPHRHGRSALRWWNTLVVFGLPSIAALVLALRGATNGLLLSGAAVGLALLAGAIVVLVLASTSERFARAVGRIGGRVVSWLRRLVPGPVTGWDEGFARFQHRRRGADPAALALAHPRHPGQPPSPSSGCCWLACRDLGVPPEVVSWPEVLGAFAVVRLATAVPITPGGLGLVEVGLTAALVLAAGDGEQVEAAIVAAVLLFRALTYLFQVILGVICAYLIWQREAKRQAGATEAPAETGWERHVGTTHTAVFPQVTAS